MKHTLTVCLGSLVLALLGACSSDNEVPQPGKEEGHRVDIVLSGSPAAGRTVGTGTRALVVTGIRHWSIPNWRTRAACNRYSTLTSTTWQSAAPSVCWSGLP